MAEKKKALAKVEPKSPWSQGQIDLITNTVAKGATPDELKLFLYTASRTGLDPLTKQIHFVKRGGSMTIQTGIDGYRTIAERSGKLAGIEDAVYDSEEEPQPKKATVTVWKMVEGQRVSFTASARWSEYAPKDSKNAFLWTKMPYLMLAKCAESLALRKAFPNDLTGLYTNEEMQQAEPAKEPLSGIETKPADKEYTLVTTDEGVQKVPRNCPYCAKEHTGPYDKCTECHFEQKRTGVIKKKLGMKATPIPDISEQPF